MEKKSFDATKSPAPFSKLDKIPRFTGNAQAHELTQDSQDVLCCVGLHGVLPVAMDVDC